MGAKIVVPPGLPAAEFDMTRIREVLIHLLENAGKYAPAGTPIRISADTREGTNRRQRRRPRTGH